MYYVHKCGDIKAYKFMFQSHKPRLSLGNLHDKLSRRSLLEFIKKTHYLSYFKLKRGFFKHCKILLASVWIKIKENIVTIGEAFMALWIHEFNCDTIIINI